MHINHISPQNRPRERMLEHGPSALSDAELLAIVIQKGFGKKNVLEISNEVLSEYGIENLPGISLTELRRIYGIGQVKAMQIKALFELSRRHTKAKRNSRVQVIKNPHDIYNMFVDDLAEKKKEHFYVVMLDSANQVVGTDLVTIGTINCSIIHPREVFRPAIKNSANSIVLVHNHPSGNLIPSREDIEITDRIKEVGEVVGIKVLDHVIIGRDGYGCV